MNMKNGILDKNLDAMTQRYPELKDYVTDYINSGHTLERVFIDKSIDEKEIFGIVDNGRDVYLNSRYEPEKAAKQWAEQYKDVNFQSVFFVLGLANGMYIEALVRQLIDNNKIMIYEPEKEIFIQLVQNIDISEIILNENICIVVNEINEKMGLNFIMFNIEYSNLRLIENIALPNYLNLYSEQWQNVIKKIKERVTGIVAVRNTRICFKNEFIQNVFMNYKDMVSQYSVNQIIEKMSDIDFDKTPAIVVAAGPSLDKNICELKKAKGKAFIIAVDTALNSLAKADIVPDIAVTVDPHKPIELFQHKKMRNVPMVVDKYSNKDVIAALSCKKFYMNGNDYMAHIYEKYEKPIPIATETGGSVANNAFSLAQCIGFKTIILVGQDLAYTDNKIHTTNAYKGNNIFDKEDSNDYVLVDAIDGGKVWTKSNMTIYLNWFENQIEMYPDLKVIDATEGGALKKGSVIMTLREAVEKECNGNYDFEERISEIENIFTEAEQREIYNDFLNLPDDILECKKKLEKGIRNYDKMLELHKKGKNGTKEYKRILEEIQNINEYTEKDPLMLLLKMYIVKDDYEVQAEVYDIKQDDMEEIKSIHRIGVKMLNSHIDALKEIKEDIRFLNNKEIVQLLANRFNKILCNIDDVCYEISKEDLKKAEIQFNNFIINSTNAIDIIKINYQYLESNGLEFDYMTYEEIINNIMSAKEESYNKVCDILQSKVKILIKEWIKNATDKKLVYFEIFEENNSNYALLHNEKLSQQLECDFTNKDGYIVEKTTYNMPTLKRINKENEICFYSNENPQLEAEQARDSININSGNDIVILGMGLGYIALALNSKEINNNIYIYEHEINVLKLAFKYVDLQSVLEKRNFHIIYDPNLKEYIAKIKEGNNILYIDNPSFMNIDDEKLRQTVKELN